MRKLHFFLLIFATSVYCQDISYIRSLDTIFVNFKKDKFQTKVVLPVNNFNFQERRYTINFEDFKTINPIEGLRFYFSEYPSYKRREMNNKSDTRSVNKTFLRKNRNKTISIDFFKKYGICKSTYEAFADCKVIYIIDCDERKNGQITLYEVTKGSTCEMGE